MSGHGGWPGGIPWSNFDDDGDHRDYSRGPFVYSNIRAPNGTLHPQLNRADRGGHGSNGRDTYRQGGNRLGSDRGRNGNGYRDLPEFLRRLNLNGGLQGGRGPQRPNQWRFGGPPVPGQPVPRPDTPEPSAPSLPRPPSRPVSPLKSTPEPRPYPSGGEDREDGEDIFTTWVLRLDTDQHKCVDEGLFRQPFSPDPIVMENDRILQPRGTVVLPIKPGRRYNMDMSVMTISNVLYTPRGKHSELSFPVLEKQGFALHETRRPPASILRRLPRAFAKGKFYTLQHDNLPGVYILYACRLDGDPNRLSVLPPKPSVDKGNWIEGVQSGVLGRAVDMDGTLGWTEASEHSKFEELVLDPLGRRRADLERIAGEDDITTVLH
ncbi:uncharacterized protein A1O9_06293 [Exophiala aquamarina CBS 119918]|uniref:Uncharacterized protein n=1 Tax=Exophiala aquamarina CBS 119918 TaxID=1182545 RepID=A0A072PF43_9EURO|nr:uncharacterized protein A1O9_06293 [Exophiala aquamarina CBS 119918]KEF58367.1 hypothetical protein A1O9_06293 [Exophiala aquamarina CBS 119918]